MTKVIESAKGKEYCLKCEHCGSVSQYNEFDHDGLGRPTLEHYEDCHDTMCVEYQCPVCGKHTSIYERDLEHYNVDALNLKKGLSNKEDKLNWKHILDILFMISCIVLGILIGIKL